MSHPTAMRPDDEVSVLRSSTRAQQHHGARHRKAQSEHDGASGVPPQLAASAAPMAVVTAMSAIAPGIAMPRTARRSAGEKCRPTPNISRITPTSASWAAISASATMPG